MKLFKISKEPLWVEKNAKQFFLMSLVFLLFATYFMIPTLTSLYYYAWGGHLDWAYFDGPPMIAYFFFISKKLFGTTYFSINVVGFFCFTCSIYYMYHLGLLLKNERTGITSALIWATLPLCTENVFIRAVYDAPLNLFTIMTFYYFACYQRQNQPRFLYQTALSMSCMILSKFTAAVTVLGIVLYLLVSQYRSVFRKGHFYGACLVIVLMLAPLLYWNAKHQWITITYLLSFHSQSENHLSIMYSLMKLLFVLLTNFSVFLVLSFLGLYKYQKSATQSCETNVAFEFIATVFLVSLVFWFIVIGLGGAPRSVYLTPLGINMALLSGYAIQHYDYQRFFKGVYPLFLCLAIGAIVANMYPIGTYFRKGITYNLIQNFSKQAYFIKKDEPIVTGSYTSAAIISFFLPQYAVYTLPCNESNQYHYWSESFLKTLSQKKSINVRYIDFENTKKCALQLFSHCRLLTKMNQAKTIPFIDKTTKSVSLYEYECD